MSVISEVKMWEVTIIYSVDEGETEGTQTKEEHAERQKCKLKVQAQTGEKGGKDCIPTRIEKGGKQLREADDGCDDVERLGRSLDCMAVTGVAERVVRSRGRQCKKATPWWSDEARDVVKPKKDLCRKALNENTDEAW